MADTLKMNQNKNDVQLDLIEWTFVKECNEMNNVEESDL